MPTSGDGHRRQVPMRRAVREETPEEAPKIPNGVMDDIFDLYYLEKQIVNDLFAGNLHTSQKLNYLYRELLKKIRSMVTEWNIGPDSNNNIKLRTLYVPFNSPFSAETEFRAHTPEETLYDEATRRNVTTAMSDTCDSIKEVLDSKFVNRNDLKRDADVQKMITEVKFHLDDSEAKRKDANAVITQIKIIELPEVTLRNVEDNVIHKGSERIHLPKFKPTQWTDITMRFTSGTEVVVTIGKDNYPLDYKILGFGNEKSEGPNVAWKFLYWLALHGGATQTLEKPIPDKIKQHKLQVVNLFKAIFKNPTDPFDDPTDTPDHVYRIKIKLIPPETEDPDKLGLEEYRAETMTEVYIPEKWDPPER